MKDSEAGNTDGTRVFQAVWKTYRTLLARSDSSKKRLELCDSDFRVMDVLLHEGSQAVNVIGQLVNLTTGSITTAIDRLEQKSLVERKNHDTDRRIRIVELTPKGRKLIEKAYAHYRSDMEAAVKILSRQERTILLDLLNRLEGQKDRAHTA
jgi:MarR family 2-MHQ and catechol resistance regulon transcriptional repressor